MSTARSSFVPPMPVIMENLRRHRLKVVWSELLDDEASDDPSMCEAAARAGSDGRREDGSGKVGDIGA